MRGTLWIGGCLICWLKCVSGHVPTYNRDKWLLGQKELSLTEGRVTDIQLDSVDQRMIHV